MCAVEALSSPSYGPSRTIGSRITARKKARRSAPFRYFRLPRRSNTPPPPAVGEPECVILVHFFAGILVLLRKNRDCFINTTDYRAASRNHLLNGGKTKHVGKFPLSKENIAIRHGNRAMPNISEVILFE